MGIRDGSGGVRGGVRGAGSARRFTVPSSSGSGDALSLLAQQVGGDASERELRNLKAAESALVNEEFVGQSLGQQTGRAALQALGAFGTIIDAPRAGVANTLNAIVPGDHDFNHNFKSASDDSVLESFGKGLGNFIVDSALDPLTYVTFGGSILGKKLASEAAESLTRAAAKDLDDQLLRRFATQSKNISEVVELGRKGADVDGMIGEAAGRRGLRDIEDFDELGLVDQALTANAARVGKDTRQYTRELGARVFGSKAAEAYLQQGSTGLRKFLDSEGLGDMFDQLPGDLRGGVRIRVPMSGARGRVPITGSFGGASAGLVSAAGMDQLADALRRGGGSALEHLGMDGLSVKSHLLRNKLRAQGAGRWLGDNLQGRDGQHYGEMLAGLIGKQVVKDGKEIVPLTYQEWRALREGRTNAAKTRQLISQSEQQTLAQIRRHLEEIVEPSDLADPEAPIWSEFTALFNDPGFDHKVWDELDVQGKIDMAEYTGMKESVASAAAAARLFLTHALDDMVKAGVRIEELDAYIARILDPDHAEFLAKRKPARPSKGKGTGQSSYDPTEQRRRFLRAFKKGEAGGHIVNFKVSEALDSENPFRVEFRHLTPGEANAVSAKTVFEEDPLTIVTRYASAARHLAARHRYAQFLHEAGVLTHGSTLPVFKINWRQFEQAVNATNRAVGDPSDKQDLGAFAGTEWAVSGAVKRGASEEAVAEATRRRLDDLVRQQTDLRDKARWERDLATIIEEGMGTPRYEEVIRGTIKDAAERARREAVKEAEDQAWKDFADAVDTLFGEGLAERAREAVDPVARGEASSLRPQLGNPGGRATPPPGAGPDPKGPAPSGPETGTPQTLDDLARGDTPAPAPAPKPGPKTSDRIAGGATDQATVDTLQSGDVDAFLTGKTDKQLWAMFRRLVMAERYADDQLQKLDVIQARLNMEDWLVEKGKYETASSPMEPKDAPAPPPATAPPVDLEPRTFEFRDHNLDLWNESEHAAALNDHMLPWKQRQAAADWWFAVEGNTKTRLQNALYSFTRDLPLGLYHPLQVVGQQLMKGKAKDGQMRHRMVDKAMRLFAMAAQPQTPLRGTINHPNPAWREFLAEEAQVRTAPAIAAKGLSMTPWIATTRQHFYAALALNFTADELTYIARMGKAPERFEGALVDKAKGRPVDLEPVPWPHPSSPSRNHAHNKTSVFAGKDGLVVGDNNGGVPPTNKLTWTGVQKLLNAKGAPPAGDLAADVDSKTLFGMEAPQRPDWGPQPKQPKKPTTADEHDKALRDQSERIAASKEEHLDQFRAQQGIDDDELPPAVTNDELVQSALEDQHWRAMLDDDDYYGNAARITLDELVDIAADVPTNHPDGWNESFQTVTDALDTQGKLITQWQERDALIDLEQEGLLTGVEYIFANARKANLNNPLEDQDAVGAWLDKVEARATALHDEWTAKMAEQSMDMLDGAEELTKDAARPKGVRGVPDDPDAAWQDLQDDGETLYIVACGQEKGDAAAAAQDLYTSTWFKEQLATAQTFATNDKIRILSGKHGLLRLDEVIDPYDQKITPKMRGKVEDQLAELDLDPNRFVVFGGAQYRELMGELGDVVSPNLGKGGIGQQRKFLKAVRGDDQSLQAIKDAASEATPIEQIAKGEPAKAAPKFDETLDLDGGELPDDVMLLDTGDLVREYADAYRQYGMTDDEYAHIMNVADFMSGTPLQEFYNSKLPEWRKLWAAEEGEPPTSWVLDALWDRMLTGIGYRIDLPDYETLDIDQSVIRRMRQKGAQATTPEPDVVHNKPFTIDALNEYGFTKAGPGFFVDSDGASLAENTDGTWSLTTTSGATFRGDQLMDLIDQWRMGKAAGAMGGVKPEPTSLPDPMNPVPTEKLRSVMAELPDEAWAAIADTFTRPGKLNRIYDQGIEDHDPFGFLEEEGLGLGLPTGDELDELLGGQGYGYLLEEALEELGWVHADGVLSDVWKDADIEEFADSNFVQSFSTHTYKGAMAKRRKNLPYPIDRLKDSPVQGLFPPSAAAGEKLRLKLVEEGLIPGIRDGQIRKPGRKEPAWKLGTPASVKTFEEVFFEHKDLPVGPHLAPEGTEDFNAWFDDVVAPKLPDSGDYKEAKKVARKHFRDGHREGDTVRTAVAPKPEFVEGIEWHRSVKGGGAAKPIIDNGDPKVLRRLAEHARELADQADNGNRARSFRAMADKIDKFTDLVELEYPASERAGKKLEGGSVDGSMRDDLTNVIQAGARFKSGKRKGKLRPGQEDLTLGQYAERSIDRLIERELPERPTVDRKKVGDAAAREAEEAATSRLEDFARKGGRIPDDVDVPKKERALADRVRERELKRLRRSAKANDRLADKMDRNIDAGRKLGDEAADEADRLLQAAVEDMARGARLLLDYDELSRAILEFSHMELDVQLASIDGLMHKLMQAHMDVDTILSGRMEMVNDVNQKRLLAQRRQFARALKAEFEAAASQVTEKGGRLDDATLLLQEKGYQQFGSSVVDSPTSIMSRIPPDLDVTFMSHGVRVAVEKQYRATRPGGDDALAKWADNVLRPVFNLWRAMATSLRGPGYHARNASGAMWNNWIGGVEAKWHTTSHKLVKMRGEALDEALEAERQVLNERLGRKATKEEETAFISPMYVQDRAELLLSRNPGMKEVAVGDLTFADLHQLAEENLVGYTPKTMEGLSDNADRTVKDLRAFVQGQNINLFEGLENSRGSLDNVANLNRAQRGMNKVINNWWGRRNMQLATRIEDVFRIAAFAEGVSRYGAADGGKAAALLPKGLHFDYHDLSDVEKKYLRGFLVPFYVWTRNNVPLQIRALVKEPARVNALIRLNENMAEQFEDDEIDIVPEWMQERMGFVSRFRSKSGHPILIGTDLPIADVNRWLKIGSPGLNEGLAKSYMREGISIMNPFLAAWFEQSAGVEAYTGRKFNPAGKSAPLWYRALAKVPGLGGALPLTQSDGVIKGDDAKITLAEDMLPPLSMLSRFAGAVGGLAGSEALSDRENRRRAGTNLNSLVGGTSLLGYSTATLTPLQAAGELARQAETARGQNLFGGSIREGIDNDVVRDAIFEMRKRGLTPEQINNELRRMGVLK